MSRMRVHKDHQVICEARVFHGVIPPVARGGLRSLQHAVHLGKVDVAEQRGDHATYAKGNFEFERRISLCRTLSVLDLRRKK
jgi:hypothetical protein